MSIQFSVFSFQSDTTQQGLVDDSTGLSRTNPTKQKLRASARLRAACFITLSLALISFTATAQDPPSDYQKAVTSIETDLAAELERLAALRAEIAAEKPTIARETNEIAAELREKRRRSDLANQERDALIHDLTALSNRVKIWRDERNYIDSLLDDFRKQHESQISLAEAAGTDFSNHLDLAGTALARLAAPSRVINGEAINPAGVAIPGTFVEVGPVNWFVSEDGKIGGLVAESRGLEPEMAPGTADPRAILNLAEGKAASPKFDPSLGTAIALENAESSLLDHIKQGGFWIYPILLLALIATIAAIAKWIQLGRIRELRPAVVQRVLAALGDSDPKQAVTELESVRHPAKTILNRGIEIYKQPREDVEEALFEKFLEAQPPLQRWLPLIAIASATAPLLGLLGTVTGMIHTFKLIDIFGTGDAKSLASGISEALVTTEFGLVVAIPALILHALLNRKVQGIKATMEMTSLAFLNGLSAVKGGEKS